MPNTLITIPISHYCEKARWALEHCGVAYQERPHLQGLHIFAARRAGGGRTVPVLVTDHGVLTESADIVAHADAHAPPERRLYPDDPQIAAEIRALEHDFDTRLGVDGRRWMYDSMRGQRALVIAYAPKGVPAWQRRALPAALGTVTRFIDRYLDVNAETARASLGEVHRTFDAVAERLSDGRPFLTGDRFTAADLTFAALAGSVTLPPEYGVPLPQPDELPPAMAATVRELREHPAGAFALALFRDQRR